LAALRPLPACLEITARTGDGVIMGVRHRDRPQWGVQFHPESVESEHGAALLRNFAALTVAGRTGTPAASHPRANTAPPRSTTDRALAAAARPEGATRRGVSVVAGPAAVTSLRRPRIHHEIVDRAVDTEAAFVRLHAHSPTAFRLDSEHVEPGLDRFSFLGDASGPLAEVVRYRVGEGAVTVRDADGAERRVPGDVLGYLSRQLRDRRVELPDLPFDFGCGYVGYLGYEIKADCGATAVHRAPAPAAQWIFAARLFTVDHVDGRTHLLALSDPGDPRAGDDHARRWLRDTRAVLDTLPSWANPPELRVEADLDAVAAGLTRERGRA